MSVAYTIPALDQTIWLAIRPFATGGEGALYRIVAPEAYQCYVVKLIHPNKRNSQRIAKAKLLAAHPPPLPPTEETTIIWIDHLVYDQSGAFVGLLMPEASGIQLELLTTAHLPRRHAADWADWARGQPKAWGKRLALGYQLAAAVYAVHQSERYSLSDLKPDNILVMPDGRLTLVDMDSVAVWEAGVLIFKASVATPEYTPPEANRDQGKPTLAWDRFSLAVILYRLLLGVHPFAASALAPYDQLVTLSDKIEAGLFVQAPVVAVEWQTKPFLHRDFALLHPIIQTLFIRAFQAGHATPEARPSAKDWAEALAQSHATIHHHPLPSSQLQVLLERPEAGYDWMMQQTLQHYQQARQGNYQSWQELPSAELIRRIGCYYKKVGHMVGEVLKAMGLLVSLVILLVSLGGQGMGATGWELFRAVCMVVWENFPVNFLQLALLMPFLWAVLEELGDSWWAWRQKRWLNKVTWRQLGNHALKRLQRWKERLFHKRSKLRHQLRALEKEQALYVNVKQERERQLKTQYHSQLQQLYTELDDYQTVWQEALEEYDNRAYVLYQAERIELQVLANASNINFPTLLPVDRRHQVIRDHYAQQHTDLLEEVQQAHQVHKMTVASHLNAWNHKWGLSQQLLDGDYRSVLGELEKLNQQVAHQKRALDKIDQRLKTVQQALK